MQFDLTTGKVAHATKSFHNKKFQEEIFLIYNENVEPKYHCQDII
jgi:hypothetical protein